MEKRRQGGRKLVFEGLEQRLPFHADWATVEPDVDESIIDVLANDGLGRGAQIGAVTAAPASGTAEIVFGDTRLRYVPDPGFLGTDQLSYRAIDDAGRSVQATVRIEVGAAAVRATILEEWNSATAASNEDILLRLESAEHETVRIPSEGVLIDRPLRITTAKTIEGDGNIIQLTGPGKMVVDLDDRESSLQFKNAIIQWRRPFAGSAIDVISGQLSAAANTFQVLGDPLEGGQRFDDANWLIQVLGDDASAHLHDNSFQNAYWRSANLIRSTTSVLEGFSFTSNEVSYFDRGIYAHSVADGVISGNRFFRTTGAPIAINDSHSVLVADNRITLSGSSAIEAHQFDFLEVANNTLVNSGDTAIALFSNGGFAQVTDNFIHGSRGDGVAITARFAAAVDRIVFSRNVLAANEGVALRACDVEFLVANENLIHENQPDAKGNQHAFERVAQVEEADNLQDQNHTSADVYARKTFGANAQAYSFRASENPPVAIENRLTPAASNDKVDQLSLAENDAQEFIRQLQQGGKVTPPPAGVVIRQVVTLQFETQIIGGGPIKIGPGGRLIIDMLDSNHRFTMQDTTVSWSLDLENASPPDPAFHFRNGIVTLTGNRFDSNVRLSESHYDDSDGLFYRSAPSTFFHLGATNGQLRDLHIANNRFTNAYWYSTQLFKSASGLELPRAVISDNEVRYYHGAFYLNGLVDAQVVGNRLFRNSFGNIVATGRRFRISENKLLFPGNGTSGDGITIGAAEDVLVEDNIISNGTCYGVWLVDSATDVEIRNNVLHAGITAGLNFDTAEIEVLGSGNDAVNSTRGFDFDRIRVVGNLFSHNAGPATRAVETRGVEFRRNLLHANNNGGAQHVFLGVVDVEDDENFLSNDNGRVQAYPLTHSRFVLEGKTLTVYGTSADENFAVEPDYRNLLRVRWQGWTADYSPAKVDEVRLESGGGADYAKLDNASGRHHVAMAPLSVTATTSQYQIVAAGFSSVLAIGAGSDSASLQDSPANDALTITEAGLRLRSDGFDYRLAGFAETSTVFASGGEDSAAYRLLDGPASLNVQLGEGIQLLRHANARHQIATPNRPVPLILEGSQGDDRLDLVGSSVDDTAWLSPRWGRLTSSLYNLQFDGFEKVIIEGNGGRDSAKLRDGLGNDEFWARQSHAYMKGDGFLNEVRGYRSVQGTSTSGKDTARLFDSAGDDLFNAYPESAELNGPGFRFTASQFTRVFANASAGADQARLWDSAAKDRFFGRVAYSYMQGDTYLNQASSFDRVTGTSTNRNSEAFLFDSHGDDRFIGRQEYAFLEGDGFLNEARGFQKVKATASEGLDHARFYDSSGDDLFVGRPSYAYLAMADNRLNSAHGFDKATAFSSAGFDEAFYSDSPVADRFVARHGYSYMEGPGYLNQANGFRKSSATAFLGGEDVALLFDTPASDRAVARATNAYIAGDGLLNEAIAFPEVRLRATLGGDDQAILYGSAGRDTFVARPEYSYLQGTGFLNQADGFGSVEAINGQPGDTAIIRGSTNDEHFVGAPTRVVMIGSTFQVAANGFGAVFAYGGGSNDGDTATLQAGGLNAQFVSRPVYDYMQWRANFVQVAGFEDVDARGDDSAFALLADADNSDVLRATPDGVELQRAARRTKSSGFLKVTARAAFGAQPIHDPGTVDAAIALTGNWIRSID